MDEIKCERQRGRKRERDKESESSLWKRQCVRNRRAMLKSEDASNSNLCAWNMFYESILLAILLTSIEQFGEWSSAICLMFGKKRLLFQRNFIIHLNSLLLTTSNKRMSIWPSFQSKSKKVNERQGGKNTARLPQDK